MNIESDIETRREGAAVFLRNLRSADFRNALAKLGRKPEQEIVLFLESDTLGHVVGRLIDEAVETDTIIAVYSPATGTIQLGSVGQPGATRRANSETTAKEMSTIGMVFDVMKTEKLHTFDVSFTWTRSTSTVTISEPVLA